MISSRLRSIQLASRATAPQALPHSNLIIRPFLSKVARSMSMMAPLTMPMYTCRMVIVKALNICILFYQRYSSGACGFGGSNCTTVEFTLSNGDSSARLFYLDPYGYNVPVGFEYYHGCDGERYECLPSAAPCGNPPVLTCSANDVNLHFNFCS